MVYQWASEYYELDDAEEIAKAVYEAEKEFLERNAPKPPVSKTGKKMCIRDRCKWYSEQKLSVEHPPTTITYIGMGSANLSLTDVYKRQVQRGFNGSCLFGEIDRLFEQPKIGRASCRERV